LRDTTIVGTAITVSALKVGDWFTVNLSNSFTQNNFDGIYQVAKSYKVTKNIPSVGFTTTLRVVEVNNVSFGSTNGVMNEEFAFGEFSWGKIQFLNRTVNNALEFTPNPYSGITTSPLIQREKPLKNNNYVV
jgi:hypothetical protein